jgi:hypothetical protein
MIEHSGIHIFVNNRKIDMESNSITGNEILRKAGFSEAEHWDLYRLQSNTDSTGGIIVGAGETLRIKDGDWFRVIEGHHTRE